MMAIGTTYNKINPLEIPMRKLISTKSGNLRKNILGTVNIIIGYIIVASY